MVEIIKDYAAKRLDLLKMNAMEKGVLTAGTVTFVSLLAVFGIFFILLVNIAIGLWLGYLFGNFAYGFFAIAGFYLLLIILVLVFSKQIKNGVANKILKSIN